MAKVTVAQIIAHPRFLKAFLEALTKRSALIRSGIAEPDPFIAQTIAGFTNAGAWLESNTINMPFVRRWVPNVQRSQSNTETVPDDTSMEQDVAPIIRDAMSFSAENLASEMAGVDFVTQAAGQLADNWIIYRQRLLSVILKGVFANNALATTAGGNGGDLILDISGKADDAAYLDKTTLLYAAQLLGDAKGALSAIAMHSQAETHLNAIGSISYVSPAANMPATIPMYNGRTVIMDDEGCSFDPVTGKAEILLFAKGALAQNEVPRKTPFELERKAGFDADVIYSRTGCILHLRGIKYTKTVQVGATATDAELQNPSNWKRVYNQKSIGCCKLICKID
jgi:hypothetical protein